MRKLLTVPATNDRGPRFMEKALAAIHQALHTGERVVLEYGAYEGCVGLLISFPDDLEQVVISPILAGYPLSALTTVNQGSVEHPDWETWSVSLSLSPELFPIVRHSQFQDLLDGKFADPIDGLLRASTPEDSFRSRIEIAVTPTSLKRRRIAVRAVRRLNREFFRRHVRLAHWYATHRLRPISGTLARFLGLIAATTGESSRTHVLETSAGRAHEREEDLAAASDKLAGHLFECRIRLSVAAPKENQRQVLERLRVMAAAFGTFSRSRLATFHPQPVHRNAGHGCNGHGFLLSHEELATLWHPPTATVAAERMQSTEFTELEAPSFIYSRREEGAVTLGRVRFRSDSRLVGIGREDRRRHLYIVGKTGMGKTTLLQTLIDTDLQGGQGVCLIDPHGDLATNIVRAMPTHRTNDVILFDVGDRELIVPFNPLACPDSLRIDQVTSSVVSAFKKLHDSWGPRLEDTLRNAVFAVVEQRGTMLTLLRLLSDRQFRETMVDRIRDDVVRGFWTHEFAHWSESYRTEAVAAIQNKVRPFLTNTTMRAIVGAIGPSLNLRDVMDNGRVLMVNLSKGRIGEDNATLLGAFLVSSIQQAALTRADVPEVDRRDFHLYVDEFQNFTTGSFAMILSEARKYRLTLTVAHQYLKQVDDETASAVFGNVGSIVAFQSGSEDAATLAEQMSKFPGQLTPRDIANLPKYMAYARLLIDGLPSQPFSLTTIPPAQIAENRHEVVRAQSMRRTGFVVQP